MTEAVALPPTVEDLLNGRDLETKVGHTFLLIACEPEGWPKMAMLSVGEVLAATPEDLRLALYADSGTTRTLTRVGKALLVVVAEGVTYKIRLTAAAVSAERSRKAWGLALFRARACGIDEDKVGYATVEHGITYSLQDVSSVMQRWRRTIAMLEGLG